MLFRAVAVRKTRNLRQEVILFPVHDIGYTEPNNRLVLPFVGCIQQCLCSNCRYTFLAFGQGPRSCIAMRFALYEAKVALVSMVRKYRLSKTPKTPEKVTLDPKSNMTESLHPLWVKVEAREQIGI